MSDGRQLMAIDWEYAALGSRYFDIAIAAGSLESRERERLVDVVFGDTVDDALVRGGTSHRQPGHGVVANPIYAPRGA